MNDWKGYMKQNFTRLYHENHKICSPNTINSKSVDRTFLSSHSLHQLLEDESKVRVTEELYNIFVDVLNVHGRYLPSEQQWGDKLLNILFCKTQDTTKKINVLYKKRPYKIINNKIGKN